MAGHRLAKVSKQIYIEEKLPSFIHDIVCAEKVTFTPILGS
jgi:hypothetical protein